MGFAKPKAPAAPATVTTPPPTVTETQENDLKADYSQRAARRKGLLSTILSKRSGGLNASGGNSTLG